MSPGGVERLQADRLHRQSISQDSHSPGSLYPIQPTPKPRFARLAPDATGLESTRLQPPPFSLTFRTQNTPAGLSEKRSSARNAPTPMSLACTFARTLALKTGQFPLS